MSDEAQPTEAGSTDTGPTDTGPPIPQVTDTGPAPAEFKVRFTPEIETGDVPDGLAGEIAATNELMRDSLAGDTVKGYRTSWNDWDGFCQARGWCPLPADPMQLATYLTMVGAQVADGALVRDDEGNPLPGRLRPNTVAHRITAVNKVHHHAGLAPPGKDPSVEAVLRGLRRTFGTAPLLAKAALDMPLLEQLLAIVDDAPLDVLRDRALLALLSATDGSTGQFARLEWEGVDLGNAPSVELAPMGRSTQTVVHGLVARPGDPLCPVDALRRLRARSGSRGFVFANSGTGKAFSRQGIRQALLRLTGSGSPDPFTLKRCAAKLSEPTLRQRRDRALLLCGWWAALRRSNLVAARWDHTNVVEGDWELKLRRSKNNPYGAKDQKSWFIKAPDGWPCPVEAMDAWCDALSSALGITTGELKKSSFPIFVHIDRHGNVVRTGSGTPAPISGDAVCTIVQDLAAAAGLDAEDFGAHSLRSGFITEALTDDKLSIADAQDVSFHEDINELVSYRRKVNRRRDNPVRRMFEHAKRTVEAPPPAPPSPAEVMRVRRLQR